ncbi:MAG: hypothetical protein LBC83_07990 [Oscillospiraceae bacterium]|jgi:hypothetical protein|nr:hypothetical protein [Oscillospiraceae bacterium]
MTDIPQYATVESDPSAAQDLRRGGALCVAFCVAAPFETKAINSSA